MFITSLYINTNTELTKEGIMTKIVSKSTEEKISGMKDLISYISQGKQWDKLIHTIVKEILFVENNDLKRLMYYFLELYICYMDDSEMLLLNNQIRKDLENPNEYIRGITLKYVSTLENEKLTSNFYKSIQENITHSVGYVRRNAYYCISTLNKKFGAFEDASQILYNALYKEVDPSCLCQAFNSLWNINEEKAHKFAKEVLNRKCKELSSTMIEKIDDLNFLQNFIEDANTTIKIEACLKILNLVRKSGFEYKKKNLQKYCEILFDNIKECDDYLILILQTTMGLSNTIELSKYSKEIIEFTNPYDNNLSKVIFKFIFSVCKISDALEPCEMAVKKLVELEKMSSNKNVTEIIILNEFSQFIEKYGIYNRDLILLCKKFYLSGNPELSSASLGIFENICKIKKNEEIIKFVTENILKIQYGKIIRDTMEFLKKFIDSDEFSKLIEILNIDFTQFVKQDFKNLQFFREKNKILVPYLAIALTEIYWNFKSDIETKSKLIALLYGIYKTDGLCDSSSTSTILLCIQSLISQTPKNIQNTQTKETSQKIDVCEPIEIPFCVQSFDTRNEKLKRFLKTENSSENINNVIQLTGLSDPIYVEANMTYSRFEIVVDLLMINRTENYLQNILFDFVTSTNIKYIPSEMPESMNGQIVLCKKVYFRVLNSSNGFINGSMSFKYPNESGEYAKQTCTLNFAEIKTSISDFLESKKCTNRDFISKWRIMEWENVYSMKLFCQMNLQNIFENFVKLISGHIVEFVDDDNIFVGNISCTTRQNNDILFNLCMSKSDPYVNMECRIRSSKEDIVKSMSGVLNQIVRQIKSK